MAIELQTVKTALAVAKAALKTCTETDSFNGTVQFYNKGLVATALRTIIDPALLSDDEKAQVLYLELDIARHTCKKAVLSARGDYADARAELLTGNWKRWTI